MKSKLAALVLSGLVGLGLGAGIGVAAAQTPTNGDEAPGGDRAQMTLMHEEMRDQMPSSLADECDEMHGGMAGAMDEHPMLHGGHHN